MREGKEFQNFAFLFFAFFSRKKKYFLALSSVADGSAVQGVVPPTTMEKFSSTLNFF